MEKFINERNSNIPDQVVIGSSLPQKILYEYPSHILSSRYQKT